MGLSRAFIYAGAASVVVSPWRSRTRSRRRRCNTSTRPSHRGGKAAALASARKMIALLRQGKVEADGQRLPEDPLFWAAYVLVGEAR